MRKILNAPEEDTEAYERRRRMALIALEFFPDLADELREQGARRAAEQGVKQSVKQGVNQGVAVLTRLFTRRLGRDLTPDERRTVASRLRSHGAERLSDLVLDLKPAQLAAWLADPDAK